MNKSQLGSKPATYTLTVDDAIYGISTTKARRDDSDDIKQFTNLKIKAPILNLPFISHQQ